jgi:hypothetical protein
MTRPSEVYGEAIAHILMKESGMKDFQFFQVKIEQGLRLSSGSGKRSTSLGEIHAPISLPLGRTPESP